MFVLVGKPRIFQWADVHRVAEPGRCLAHHGEALLVEVQSNALANQGDRLFDRCESAITRRPARSAARTQSAATR